jgi:hypothetical protein
MNELLAIYWPSFQDFTPPQLFGMAIGPIIGGWITAYLLVKGELSKQEKRIWRLIVISIYFLLSFCFGSIMIHSAHVEAVIDAIKQFKQGPSYYAKPEHSQELKTLAPRLTDEDCQEITSRLNVAEKPNHWADITTLSTTTPTPRVERALPVAPAASPYQTNSAVADSPTASPHRKHK